MDSVKVGDQVRVTEDGYGMMKGGVGRVTAVFPSKRLANVQKMGEEKFSIPYAQEHA